MKFIFLLPIFNSIDWGKSSRKMDSFYVGFELDVTLKLFEILKTNGNPNCSSNTIK